MYSNRLLATRKPILNAGVLLNRNHLLRPIVKAFYSASSIDTRYQKKLLKKAQAEGFRNIEELKEHLKEDIKKKKQEFSKIDPLKELEEYEQRVKMSSNNNKTVSRGPIDPTKPIAPFKTLDSYLKLDKIKDLSLQEIEFLWRTKWAEKERAMNAVVPKVIFEKMIVNARANPNFVLPLPRPNPDNEEQGMELHYIQWQFVGENTIHCIMTSLAEYKLHNEFARPHTTLQFHTELANEKSIVLMNGEIEPETNISLSDAQLLLLNIQRFFGAMGEETPSAKLRLKLLRDFTAASDEFNVNILIALAQSMEN